LELTEAIFKIHVLSVSLLFVVVGFQGKDFLVAGDGHLGIKQARSGQVGPHIKGLWVRGTTAINARRGSQ
jgi:hypothetical protein